MSKGKLEKKEYEFVCDFCDKSFDSKGECKKHEKECSRKNLTGIGGWLLFWVIISCLGTFFIVTFLILLPFIIQTLDVESVFTGLDLLSTIVDAILTTECLILVFLKKRIAPKAIIASLIISSLFNLINFNKIYLWQTIYDFIVNLGWIIYFLKSKRVKNTFVK